MSQIVNNVKQKLNDEPVVFLYLIQAIIALVVAFGLPLSIEQKTSIIGVTSTLLTIIARQQVTPTSKTDDHSGVRSPNMEGSA